MPHSVTIGSLVWLGFVGGDPASKRLIYWPINMRIGRLGNARLAAVLASLVVRQPEQFELVADYRKQNTVTRSL